MKKIKLLSPLLTVATISSSLIPLTSCGNNTTSTTHLKYLGSKYFNIEHNQTIDINILLDKIYTKQDIKNILLVTPIDDFLSYTYDINDTVLTLHITQVKTDNEDKEVPLEIKITTSDWTDAVVGFTLNYAFAHETGFRGYAFEATTLTYKLASSDIDLWFSKDNNKWTQMTYSDEDQNIDIKQGESIWLKGNNPNGLYKDWDVRTSLCFKNANVGREDKPSINLIGQINALLYNGEAKLDKQLPENAFNRLFGDSQREWKEKEGSTGLASVPTDFLPSTKLGAYCYTDLFAGCKNLTTTPVLPATTLTSGCYNGMFFECESLTTPPELPAKTMQDGCYMGMFHKCKSLKTAPVLSSTELAYACYGSMFYGCESLTTAPELNATTLTEGCYSGMFAYCKNLVNLPKLSVKTLAEDCYGGMFAYCTSIITPPELPATTLARRCYHSMFEGCTNLTQAPELPITKLENYCYTDMFMGCTSLKIPPALPATTLATGCYTFMFRDCTSLIKAPELPADTLANLCYYEMFANCTSLKVVETGDDDHKILTGLNGEGLYSLYNGIFYNTKGHESGIDVQVGKTYYWAD